MDVKSYSTTFIIRFIAYFCLIVGSLGVTFELGPLMVAEFNYRKDLLFHVQYSVGQTVISSKTQPQSSPQASSVNLPQSSTTPTGGSSPVSFAQIANHNAKLIKPVSTDYGIVIEKINANAKVIPEVDPSNEKEYVNALSKGVAEAKGSTKPGENGNLFIFSHSTDAPWNIIRFNAIFYLLREVEKGDRVLIFYQGRRYDYIVFDKTVIDPKDVSFLTNRYDKPVLTLQTCDPPGTVARRLIVRAQLLGS